MIDPVEEHIVSDLKSLGIRPPIDLTVPIIAGLGLDDEDWAMDFLPAIERKFGVKLDRLLLTDDYGQPSWFQRVILRWRPWRLSRDVTSAEIIAFVNAEMAPGRAG